MQRQCFSTHTLEQEAHGPWRSAWEPIGHLPKFHKFHIFSISTSGVENELIFHSMSSSFLDMWRFSKLPYLGMKLGKLPKFQKLHVYPLSTHRVEIELIFALWAAVSEIWANFQNSHIGAWNLAIGQSSRSCTYMLHDSFMQITNYLNTTHVTEKKWSYISGCRYILLVYCTENCPMGPNQAVLNQLRS